MISKRNLYLNLNQNGRNIRSSTPSTPSSTLTKQFSMKMNFGNFRKKKSCFENIFQIGFQKNDNIKNIYDKDNNENENDNDNDNEGETSPGIVNTSPIDWLQSTPQPTQFFFSSPSPINGSPSPFIENENENENENDLMKSSTISLSSSSSSLTLSPTTSFEVLTPPNNKNNNNNNINENNNFFSFSPQPQIQNSKKPTGTCESNRNTITISKRFCLNLKSNSKQLKNQKLHNTYLRISNNKLPKRVEKSCKSLKRAKKTLNLYKSSLQVFQKKNNLTLNLKFKPIGDKFKKKRISSRIISTSPSKIGKSFCQQLISHYKNKNNKLIP